LVLSVHVLTPVFEMVEVRRLALEPTEEVRWIEVFVAMRAVSESPTTTAPEPDHASGEPSQSVPRRPWIATASTHIVTRPAHVFLPFFEGKPAGRQE
jgi:hypothetical protein